MDSKKKTYLAIGAAVIATIAGGWYWYYKKPTVEFIGKRSEDDLLEIGNKLIRTDGEDGYTVKVKGFTVEFSDRYNEEGKPYSQRLFSLERWGKKIVQGVLPTEKGQKIKWDIPA